MSPEAPAPQLATFFQSSDGHFYCNQCYYSCDDPNTLPDSANAASPHGNHAKICPGCFYQVSPARFLR